MKKICVLTTCRADYGYLYFIMKDLQASYNIGLQVMCPTSHQNFKEINKEFDVCRIDPIYSIDDYGPFFNDVKDMLKVIKPDIFLVLGDRYEVHAAATAALLTGTKLCHIHGGETTTGAFDNNIRNAITMMADIHFTATESHAIRVHNFTGDTILNMERKEYLYLADDNIFRIKQNDSDEIEWYEKWHRFNKNAKIYNVGSPGLDWLTRTKLLSKQELQGRVSIDMNQPFIIACFHPVTRELADTKRQMCEFLNALISNKEQVILIRPNCDPCNEKINGTINDYLESGLLKDWYITSNLDHLTYLSLLQYAEMLVGNSSSGIIEAASFNLPAINIGNRQEGRIRNTNVIDCGYSTDEILKAIDYIRNGKDMKSYLEKAKMKNVYGDGRSSQRIVKILEELKGE